MIQIKKKQNCKIFCELELISFLQFYGINKRSCCQSSEFIVFTLLKSSLYLRKSVMSIALPCSGVKGASGIESI